MKRSSNHDRYFVQRCAFALMGFDFVCDPAGFFFAVPKALNAYHLAHIRRGPQAFAEAHLVVGDDVRRGGENVSGGTIVLFQTHNGGTREIFFKAQNIADFRAAPAID